MKLNMTAAAMAVAEASAVLALVGCGGGGGTGVEGSAEGLGADTARRQVAAEPAAASTVTVRARGTLAGNVGPLMMLRVNGTVVKTVEVRAAEYQDYGFTVSSIPAGAKVDVVFNNDATINGQDRNLFVASITANGTPIEATAAGVTYDRGTGDKAFDGLDVLPGTRSILWNGALRFTVGGGNTAGLTPECANFYASNPGFALNSSRTVDPIAALAKPVKGVFLGAGLQDLRGACHQPCGRWRLGFRSQRLLPSPAVQRQQQQVPGVRARRLLAHV